MRRSDGEVATHRVYPLDTRLGERVIRGYPPAPRAARPVSLNIWSQSYLQRTLEIMGPERILFSTDYPYRYRPGGAGRSFLEKADLSQQNKELFAHGNWERLTRSASG
ncbi:MAG TPA: amidohydrolase family protein [Acidobacteriaceae bacterium]